MLLTGGKEGRQQTKVKKLIILTLLGILLLSTFACGDGGEEVTPEPGAYLVYEVDFEGTGDTTPAKALDEIEDIIKERVYAYAFGQPVVIERIGDDRISIFLPDIKDIAEAREMVGNTAQFNIRERTGSQWVIAEVMGPDEEIMPLTGVYLLECRLFYYRPAEPWACYADLDIRFSKTGADLLGPFTQRHIGETVGIFIGDDALVQVQITERAIDVLEITPLGCWLAEYLAETIDQAALPLSLHYIGGYVYPPSTEPTGEEPTPTPAAMSEFGYLSHTDETNGFSIWCPQDWYLKEEPDLMLNLVSPRSHPGEQMWGGWWGATVALSKGSTRETLWNAFIEWKASEKELQAYAQVTEETVTVGGVSAIRQVFEYKQPAGVWITVEELFLVKDGFAYVITCAASTSLRDEYESTFDTIINSFGFLD
jgi:hypothetical protein